MTSTSTTEPWPAAALPKHAGVDVSALFLQHAPFLLRVVTRLSGPGPHVEDVVQDVFLLAHRKRDVLAQHPQPRAWLYRTAVHRLQQQRRGFARFVAMLARAQVDPHAHAAASDPGAADARQPASADVVIEQRQHAHRIRRCVLAMPLVYRETFVLFDLEGLSTREVATLLEIKEGTVSSRVAAARQHFRTLWQQSEER